MKKIISFIVIFILIFNAKIVDADIILRVGKEKTFSHVSCKIVDCVSDSSVVSVEFDEKECKYTGIEKGEASIKVSCEDGQEKNINVNVKEVNSNIFDDDDSAYENVDKYDKPTTPEETCSPLGKLKGDIQGIFKVFKIVAPILVIALSVFDFIKAVAGKVEGDLKKAFQRLLKRIIFAALLFFLPIILDWVLGLVDPGYNTCVNVL